MTAPQRRRTLVQACPYVRRRERFTAADSCGASVVRHDMAEQFLAHAVVDRVFTLALGSEDMPVSSAEADALAVGAGGLDALQEIIATDDVIFLDGLGVMPRASRLRHLFGWKMPVIGMLYSLPGPSHTGFYYWLQAELRPHDAIVAPSVAGYVALQAIFRCTSRHSLYGIPDIARIPLAVDVGAFTRGPDPASRRALGWPEDKVVVLTLGRFSEASKADLEPLLWAIGTMEARQSVYVVCAGADADGYAAKVEACAAAYGMAGQVSVVANFLLALKPTLLAAADVFVSIADNVQETFGLALLEAMASGLPVIASDWSGYRDIVAHGETGFLVDTRWSRATGAAAEVLWTTAVGDDRALHALACGTAVSRTELRLRLSDLVEQPALRARFGSNGRARVEAMFGWPSVIQQYQALIDRKLAEPPQTEPAGVPRLQEVFSHYASGTLPRRLHLCLSRSASTDAGAWARDAAPKELRAGIGTLLAKLEAAGSVEVFDGYRAGDPLAVAAAWLLKKGICDVVEPPDVSTPDRSHDAYADALTA